MVKGLERFRVHFADYTACDLAFTDVGLEFRATQDIDIVICIETANSEFGKSVWTFVQAGKYASLEAPEDKREFYRFTKPREDGFPKQLELFSRIPDVLGTEIAGHLTPIPFDEDVSSLSAILLDDDYYEWTHAGKIEIESLPIVRPEHLIPLKAKAWLDLTERSTNGQRGLSKHISKHMKDVFRIYAIVDPEYTVTPADSIRSDMQQFIERMRNEDIDMKEMGLGQIPKASVLDDLSQRYTESRS